MIRNQDMEFLHGQVETFTKEIIKMILGMGTDKCTGQMEVITKERGKMVFNMEKVNFKLI